MTGAVDNKHKFLLERTVVGLMRLASRLMRREEISSMVNFSYPFVFNFSITYFIYGHI